MDLHPVLLDKLNAAVAPAMPLRLTRRDLWLPAVTGKAHAVIGMRRAGKTSFLQQLVAERRETLPPERALLVSFDDDRLSDLGSEQLALLLEAFYRRYPELRGRDTVHWFLDEIQLVDGWERFVRRVLDTERVAIVVSGSSAKMLSREVHTSLRGRGMETVVRPFSFREYLRHRGEEPADEPGRWTSAQRSRVEKWFAEYLIDGGFPEVQGLETALRVEVLQGYVNTVLFRDVVERYAVPQVAALRWVIRQCLRNPAGALSAHRLFLDLKAQGHGVAKDTVHALLGHLYDAFLISSVPLASESERRQNANPRKVYPVDHGLIDAFDTSGRANVGHALKTVVHTELQRRKADLGYVKTTSGFEVDFLARYPTGDEDLIQVCAMATAADTMERELRALREAAIEHVRAARRLLVMTRDQAVAVARAGAHADPDGLVQPAYEWLLGASG